MLQLSDLQRAFPASLQMEKNTLHPVTEVKPPFCCKQCRFLRM